MDDSAFLASCPRRLLEWREDEQNRVVVLRPRFGSGKWGRRFAGWLGSGDYRIRLDDVGSFVWKMCDGETPVEQQVKRLQAQFGETVEPAQQRLHQFLVQMNRSRMIRF